MHFFPNFSVPEMGLSGSLVRLQCHVNFFFLPLLFFPLRKGAFTHSDGNGQIVCLAEGCLRRNRGGYRSCFY